MKNGFLRGIVRVLKHASRAVAEQDGCTMAHTVLRDGIRLRRNGADIGPPILVVCLLVNDCSLGGAHCLLQG